MMDGRDFGHPRSVHVPPPLLAMDSHRVGAGPAAGRMAPSGHMSGGLSAPLPPGKYLSSAMNLHGHPGEAFPSSMSQYLGGLVASGLGASTPHGTPNSLSSDPSFRSATPTNLQMVHELWAAHSHEGFSHLASGLYPSYIPLNQLEASSNGSPLLAQLGQHSLFESQKDAFYLSGHAGQSALHPQTSIAKTMANHTPSSHMREKDHGGHQHKSAKETAKERACRNEHSLSYGKKDGKPKEEPRPRSVVDLTQDLKPDSERKLSGLERAIKHGERLSPFLSEHMPNRGCSSGEQKSKNPLQTSLLSNCNSGGDPLTKVMGTEQDRCAKDPSRHDENMRPSAHTHTDRTKRCDSVVTSIGSLHAPCSCPSPHPSQQPAKMVAPSTFPPQPVHSSMYTIFPQAKDPGREHKVIAPTFVPSVEAYDERIGPIQIASQARDIKGKDTGKVGMLHSPGERLLSDCSRPQSQEFPFPGDAKRGESLREKSSVIRSNSMVMKRPAASEPFLHRSGLGSPESREFLASKDLVKQCVDNEPRSCDRERFQRSCSKESSKACGTMDSSRQHLEHTQLKSPEQKWKPFEMGNFATTQMAVLAAQHNHANRVEEDAKKAYLDSATLQRSTGGSRGTADVHHPTSQGEGSAMQSLIKYSGSFAKEATSRQSSGKKSPFGGLGNMKLDQSQLNASKIQQLLSQQCGKKRDPERPESAKSFGRESIGSQGEVEIRHPPVGIAVAVARQKDNSGNKLGPSLADRDRSLSMSCIKGPGRSEDDTGDDRNRHREDRLLAGRLERDQEKLLRESKEIADFARMHPAVCATNSLNSNLMVTGGPSLTGSGRWPVDPASHLATHHWLPRTGSPSMWLAGHPYGLGHPSLHQGMPPGYPPNMAGSLPSAYQFIRDPQSGQFMVIPSEHMPHFAELMERAPPIWPAMYPPTRSSLQHAHQLQLLSHQQLLRQHELYILQQQAAHAMELQRSAQLVERLKANEQRLEMEEKVSKRNSDSTKQGISSSSSGHLQRKSHVVSPSASASYSKAVNSPAISPICSPIAVLKAEVIRKLEEQSTQMAYSYPATPRSHQSSPPLASPPPAPALPPKEEALEDVVKKDFNLDQEASTPFDALFPEMPPGYSFQSLSSSFRRHYPYLLQPTAASDADGLAPDVPMSTEGVDQKQPSPGIKPMHIVSSEMVDPLISEAETLKERVKAEVESQMECQEDICEQSMEFQNATEGSLDNVERSSILIHQDDVKSALEQDEEASQICQPVYHEVASPKETEAEVETDSSQEICSNPIDFSGTPTDTNIDHPVLEKTSGHDKLSLSIDTKDSDSCRQEDYINLSSEEKDNLTDAISYVDEPIPFQIPNVISMEIKMEDPLAGMNALVAATEMPEAFSMLTANNAMQTQMDEEVTSLDPTFLQGISLLSEIAELELEKRKQEIQSLESIPFRPSLESLLIASTHMLMEVLSAPTMDSLKENPIRLPRELNPNKKYSWMQKKDEPLYSMKSSIDNMDAMELDYRVQMAELQRRYREKQRELVKLQRRKDSKEKCDEKSRSLTRRGPGRPKKRKHGSHAPSSSMERGMSESKIKKLSKTQLLSEDSEMGEVMRKRQKVALQEEEGDEMESVSGKVKGRNRSWDEYEGASSFSNEVHAKRRKKRQASDQEQLANKLDKALSITKLDKLKSPFKFAERCGGKEKCGSGGDGSSSKYLTSQETLLGKDEHKQWVKGLHLPSNTSKGAKHKMASKMKIEVRLKSKGQLKASHSPAMSEVSSFSYNTDSEEDDESLKDEWPSQSPSSSKMRHSSLYRASAKKNKTSGGFKPAKKGTSSNGTLKSKQAASGKKQICLLLQEAEAGSSFSDSSEDSFDQGY